MDDKSKNNVMMQVTPTLVSIKPRPEKEIIILGSY